MQRLMHRGYLFYTLDGFGFGVINPHSMMKEFDLHFLEIVEGPYVVIFSYSFFFFSVIYNAKLSSFVVFVTSALRNCWPVRV